MELEGELYRVGRNVCKRMGHQEGTANAQASIRSLRTGYGKMLI